MNLILIIVTTALVNNVVLSQFLGICSFLGVSSQKKASLSLGLAVMAVLTVSFLGSRLPEKFRSPLEWAAFGLLLLGGTRSVSLFYMAVTFSGLLIARTRRAVLSRKWIPAGILVPWLSLYLPQLGESFAFVHSEFCYFLLGLILVVPFFYSG